MAKKRRIPIKDLKKIKESFKENIKEADEEQFNAKEQIANEWIESITSWLTLGSGIFDYFLEKEKPKFMKFLGKHNDTEEKNIINPFDLFMSFNDLLLGEYYSFARGTMRYLKILPIPRFLTGKKKGPGSKGEGKPPPKPMSRNQVKEKQRKIETTKAKTKEEKEAAKAKEKADKDAAKTKAQVDKNAEKRSKMTLKKQANQDANIEAKKEKEDTKAKAKAKEDKDAAASTEKKEKEDAKAKAKAKADKLKAKTDKDDAKAKAKEEKLKANADKEKLKKRLQEQDNFKQRVKSGTLTDTNIKEIEKDPHMKKTYKNQIKNSREKIKRDAAAATEKKEKEDAKAKAKADKEQAEKEQAEQKNMLKTKTKEELIQEKNQLLADYKAAKEKEKKE